MCRKQRARRKQRHMIKFFPFLCSSDMFVRTPRHLNVPTTNAKKHLRGRQTRRRTPFPAQPSKAGISRRSSHASRPRPLRLTRVRPQDGPRTRDGSPRAWACAAKSAGTTDPRAPASLGRPWTEPPSRRSRGAAALAQSLSGCCRAARTRRAACATARPPRALCRAYRGNAVGARRAPSGQDASLISTPTRSRFLCHGCTRGRDAGRCRAVGLPSSADEYPSRYGEVDAPGRRPARRRTRAHPSNALREVPRASRLRTRGRRGPSPASTPARAAARRPSPTREGRRRTTRLRTTRRVHHDRASERRIALERRFAPAATFRSRGSVSGLRGDRRAVLLARA